MKKQLFICVLLLIGMGVQLFAQPTQPGTPLTCNSSNCTPPLSETCTGNSTVVTNFQNAFLRSGDPSSVPGTPGGGPKAPAVYSFYNIATISGVQINATITIDQILNTDMTGAEFSIDDDAATDQAGNSIASFFAPRITPANTLQTSDERGYVQFTIRFYIENGTAGQQWPGDYTTVPPSGGLAGLNYIHYDIDGSTQGTGGWFRETGVVQNVVGSTINGDASTELSSYSYADGGNWKGFAGSVCERTGVSRCAQVAAAASYSTPQTGITVRMGYDYNFTTSNFNSRPTRQYGSRFGCFAFPQLTPLPVKLLSFTGIFRNNTTELKWATDNEVNFSHFEVERSNNGTDFSTINVSQAKNRGLIEQYNLNDDLSGNSDNIFYYRLRMVDKDGKYSYSNILVIRKEEKGIKGITVNPNPVIGSEYATLRMTASQPGEVDFKIVDMSGRILLRQKARVQAGNNNITINNLSQLQAGVYVLQMLDGTETKSVKVTINR